MARFEEIAELETRYLLPTYKRYPVAVARGKGVFIHDVDGRKYLDFVAGLGVNVLGYAHPRITKVIRDQAGRVIHTSNLFYNEYQGRLAQRLCELSGLSRVFFSNSGTEAIEGALKLARAAGHAAGGDEKFKIVALEGSFHGRTFGAISLTGQDKYRKPFAPLLEGVSFIGLNDVEGLRAAVDDSTCAVVLEPIQGEAGIRECSAEFLREARAAADRHHAVLIFDEIQSGMGRTGTMFAYQQYGLTPDVVTIAKPLAGGIPLGGFIVREELAASMTVGQHGTTFGGGPLACRVALEFLSVLEEENLLERVQRVGAYLKAQLQELIANFSVIKEARGRGMMQAVELTVPSRPIVEAALAEGVIFNSTHDVVVRFLPPYLLEEKHVDKGMKVLKKLLKKRPQSM